MKYLATIVTRLFFLLIKIKKLTRIKVSESIETIETKLERFRVDNDWQTVSGMAAGLSVFAKARSR